MPKRRNLNGLPHNLTRSFFGTERYYMCGYMGDWLLNAARRLKLNKAVLDILAGSFDPSELNIFPLTANAKDLHSIIEKELKANGFSGDFIVEAKISFEFLDPNIYRRTIYCFPTLIDKDGHKYEPGRIIEQAYEEDFDPFHSNNFYPQHRTTMSLFDKFKEIFK